MSEIEGDAGEAGAYAGKVGTRLRAIRRQKRLSLQDVEATSNQEFKASVLGAYERGERAISVPRLQRLARFYRVPVDQLLPGDDGPDFGPRPGDAELVIDLDRPTGRPDEKVKLDLTAIERLQGSDAEMLSRYLRMIQVQRGDFNGRVLTVRRDDLRALACILDVTPELATARLDALGIVFSVDPVVSAEPVVAELSTASAFGVYLHIPFCAARCDYCAFATWTDRHHLVGAYLAACRQDADRRVDAGMPPATSVFVGGGTPSMVPAADLVAVLDRVPRAEGCEVTVECNPDDVTPELIDTYLAGGVNRLSFGVQSTSAHVLVTLGRTHDRENVVRAVQLATAAGIPSFNLDLIYGGAGESLDDWCRTLDDAVSLDPPHVSAYALTVEAGTPLALDPARHPDDDDQADKYLAAVERLGAAGLDSYEISNWARPGHECRHNRLYWSMGEYQGIGCAAHSHRDGRRFWNLRTPDRYLDAVAQGASVEAADERLDDDGRALEALQLSLRTTDGVPAAALDADELPGLVVAHPSDPDRLVLTVEGRLLANEVAVRLRVPAN